MQALIVKTLPKGERWLYEVKVDGYRAIAIKNGDHCGARRRGRRSQCLRSAIVPAFAHECWRRLSRRSAAESSGAKADLLDNERASAGRRHVPLVKPKCPE